MEKICIKCKEIKSMDLFGKIGKKTEIRKNTCKSCVSLRVKTWVKDNEARYKEIKKIWKEANKEKINLSAKEWANANKEKRKNSSKRYYLSENAKIVRSKMRSEKYHNNFIYRLETTIRNGIKNAFKKKGFKKNSKTNIILGCTYIDFIEYLKSKFESWMTYDNYGKYNGELNHGWDIDHIIPLSSAKTEEELVKLNHYSNLQPLCSKINRDVKKHNIYNGQLT